MSRDLLNVFKPDWATDLAVYTEVEPAVARIEQIYDAEVGKLRRAFAAFVAGDDVASKIAAYYPFLGVYVQPEELNLDGRLAFGALHEPNVYGTTLTRPELFGNYYRDQIGRLMANHGVPVVVGVSRRPIPLPFVVDEVSGDLDPERARRVQYRFPLPNLGTTDDSIANGTWRYNGDEAFPLALFTAERVDYSLHRLHHYTGTKPEHFQPYILLTNYQRYVDHFVKFAKDEVASGQPGVSFVEPGDIITSADDDGETPSLAHLPQMPAYHFRRPDGAGVTMVNIGIGPSNARTITDHLAVLRPHCWLMLGHCAGLRRSQRLGDYVLAHAYVREDHVLDKDVPHFAPVPAIAEVQIALQQAVANVTGLKDLAMKTRMRTGTVATTDNRNWELRYHELYARLNQSRAIAVDMESATIAANGFRFRVPYGTLLCVSDKPLHGEIKLRGMANRFYRERIGQHLAIGLEAIRLLREQGVERLHSRKLRSFDEPAFR